MTGIINDSKEAVLTVRIQGPNGQETEAEAVIDTGYNGAFSLPLEIITSLGLPARGTRYVTLGDGSTVSLEIYRATVVWDDFPRSVYVMATEDVSLIGMSLLYGYRVIMDVIDGGLVTIEQRPQSVAAVDNP